MAVFGPGTDYQNAPRYFSALLEAQMATSPDGILVADKQRNLLAWNQRFLDMWSLSPEVMDAGDSSAAVAAVLAQVADPDGFRRRIEELYEALDEPENGVEVTLRDGRVLERYSRGMPDEAGGYWGRCWFYRDITQRKQAQTALQLSEQRFRAVFDRAALGIMVVNRHGHVLMMNPALERMMGRDACELSAIPFPEASHPDEVDTNQDLFADLVAGHSDSYTLEKRYLKPDGDTVWVRINASRLAEQGADGPWVLGLVEDITEQHHLWEEQRLLAEVFRTGDGVMITDAAGRILRVNPGFETLTGYHAEEVLGEPAELRSSDVEGPQRAREIEAALAEADHWAGERWSRRKDGSVFPQWETITAVRNDEGEIGRYVVLLHDLTERKLLERERQRRDSAIGELGRILAHQLNQPLTAINNFAGGMLNSVRSGAAADEDQARGLERIRTQAQRATELVSDIRRYLRGEALQTRATDLHALLHSVLPTVENLQSEAPYQLHLDLAANLPPVAGDPVPLQECLLNLVMNAVEAASEEGEPEGEVRISTQAGDSAVELAIADNGAGVPSGLEEQVFQPLFTTKPQGTGLGLSICRSVVLSHGGDIQVEAREPAGAIFRLFLPVAESA